MPKEHLLKAMERLRRQLLYAKLEKCEFWLNSVSFLRHVISREGVVVDPKKVKAVVEWTMIVPNLGTHKRTNR
jgi:hypothetical protein